MNENEFRADAKAVNMDEERIADAFRLLDEAVARGDTPGGVALIGRRGRIAGIHTAGAAHTQAPDGTSIPVKRDTIFDVASLSKVVGTLPLILLLVERGHLRLGDPVVQYIPEFAAEGKEAVTVGQLLTHTSGLLSHKNMYSHGWSPEEIKAHIFAHPLEYEPGTKMVYSDLGFITLGEIAARLYGEPLEAAATKHVFAPLGMRDTGYLPPESARPRIAATEYYEKLGRHKWGEVHDENCGALGGASGHAGLFSTAEDLAKYAAMWLALGRIGDGGGRLLSEASVATATRSHTGHLPANRGMGWVLKGDPWDASGDLLSPACYGHTGFTGTSIWMDPASDCFAVVLTNRVHYGRDKSVVRLRNCLHNAVAAACLA
ncbi:beta-lactamase family protein [Paenibacillus hemerocallicola]|uniref:Beta-lactamase family protein n=1 Tax=Paenibacillus hemerocallicola TaxID=1172614 RepID=A0A5C4TC09_9BACL|nr:serine hydrolase domain-containing protein [Paenibacillus hemerocallicola]TNJ66624.1 beta-lactamase family protein [Paenibacillus hemerocallicola]